MGDQTRSEKVKAAFAAAFDRIAVEYRDDGPTIDEVRKYAPGLASRIDRAEKDAEEAATRWMSGGRGGVQEKIDEWVKLWVEAIIMLRAAKEANVKTKEK